MCEVQRHHATRQGGHVPKRKRGACPRRCGGEFCYRCGASYPCTSGANGQPCAGAGNRAEDTPRLPVDKQMLQARRHARAVAFLMGSHPRLGEASLVKVLPTELQRTILAKA